MLRIDTRLTGAAPASATLTLAYAERQKCRQRVRLDDGREAALMLPAGTVLQPADRLQTDDGLIVAVQAAAETCSTVQGVAPLALARACYHLGNRHVPLEIGPDYCRYLHDHVLDALVRGLGLEVAIETVPFLPEAGAYGQAHSAHQHAHD